MIINKQHYKYLGSGVAGALVILFGQLQTFPQPYYIIGSFALLITALHYKLIYFIALELILAAGHTAILLGIGLYTQVALPILLCIQLLIFFLMLGKESGVIVLIGIIGIALLSLGFSHNNQWIFFFGALCISTYAYHSGYNGCYPSYIWAILNTVFACLALYRILL